MFFPIIHSEITARFYAYCVNLFYTRGKSLWLNMVVPAWFDCAHQPPLDHQYLSYVKHELQIYIISH